MVFTKYFLAPSVTLSTPIYTGTKYLYYGRVLDWLGAKEYLVNNLLTKFLRYGINKPKGGIYV